MAPAASVTDVLASFNAGADRRLGPDARALSDASERTAAAATVVDLVRTDLIALQMAHALRGSVSLSPDLATAIVELDQIRAFLHGIAGRMRQAAVRADER